MNQEWKHLSALLFVHTTYNFAIGVLHLLPQSRTVTQDPFLPFAVRFAPCITAKLDARWCYSSSIDVIEGIAVTYTKHSSMYKSSS